MSSVQALQNQDLLAQIKNVQKQPSISAEISQSINVTRIIGI